ncbi:MAG: hypothetical protein P1U34_11005 [Coxiellaceae bacterium]|nr:hypothetical protein [Coxiellaceae bacterium]
MRDGARRQTPVEINLFLDLAVIINVTETHDDSAQYWHESASAIFFNDTSEKNWLSADAVKRTNVFFMLPDENFYGERNGMRLLGALDWLYHWRKKGHFKQAQCHLLFYHDQPDPGQSLWRAHARIDSDGRLQSLYRLGPRGKYSPTNDEMGTVVVTHKQYMLDYFHLKCIHHTDFGDDNAMIGVESFREKFQAVQSKVMATLPALGQVIKPPVKKPYLRRKPPRLYLPAIARPAEPFSMPSLDSIRRALGSLPVGELAKPPALGKPPLCPVKPGKPKPSRQRFFGSRRPQRLVAKDQGDLEQLRCRL